MASGDEQNPVEMVELNPCMLKRIDTWLAGMSEDGVLVGTNWDAELEGLEVEPSDLAEELLIEEYEEEDEDGPQDDDRGRP